MGKRGPKPRSQDDAEYDGNPGKRNPPQIVEPDLGEPAMPDGMPDDAVKVWRETVPLLLSCGLIRVTHGAVLASYCESRSRWLRASRNALAEGEICESHGALSPSPWYTIANKAHDQMFRAAKALRLEPWMLTQPVAAKQPASQSFDDAFAARLKVVPADEGGDDDAR